MFLFYGGKVIKKTQVMCGFDCPKLVNSKLCCPVSLQLSIRLLDMFCACNDPK